jgi:cell division protein FtsN
MKITLLFLVAILGCVTTGCLPSESTKESAQPAVDTTRTSVPVKAVEPIPQSVAAPVERKEQGFVTHSDTIEVQVVSQKPDSAKAQVAPAVIPVESKNPVQDRKKFFALQIGAFQQEVNANRIADIFKKHSDKPIDQFYDASVKLYRVLVGSFSTKEEANAFQAQLKKDFPKEYSESWVTEVKE